MLNDFISQDLPQVGTAGRITDCACTATDQADWPVTELLHPTHRHECNEVTGVQ